MSKAPGFQELAIRDSLLITHYSLLITHYSLLITHDSSPITHHCIVFKVLTGKASAETESPRERARSRTSRKSRVPHPYRNRRAERCRSAAGRGTTQKPLSAGRAPRSASREIQWTSSVRRPRLLRRSLRAPT